MLKNKERVTKEILTLHGYISFKRTLLVPKDKDGLALLVGLTGQKSVCPVDDELGITNLPFKITYRMMAYIAKVATSARSYSEATERINDQINKPISVSTVEHVTDFVGALMFKKQYVAANEAETNLAKRKIDKRKIHKRDDEVLYIETDGAMIHVRDKEHVTLDNDKIQSDNSKKHESGWTESKHALCFHAKDIKYYYENSSGERCSGRFADILRLGDTIKVTGHRIEARDCIGYIGQSDKFQYHMLVLAERNKWECATKVVLLSDGAKWIKGIKDTIFRGRSIIQILDLFHAKENAGKFAHWAKTGSDQAEIYADHLCSLIEQGKTDELLKELEGYKDSKPPAGVPNLYTYISNNKDYMNYPRYKEQGLFVGSGAMESANIYMMQDRMKLPGMRWLVLNGRHMLCLKTYYVSRRWSEVEQYLSEFCGVRG